MRTLTERLRTLGGVAGVVAAVGGGIGAAVGMYSLPDPTAADVSAHVYAAAGQFAYAVLSEPQPDGSVIRTEFQMGRVAKTYYPPPYAENHVGFAAGRMKCNALGECEDLGGWSGPISMEQFEFDPLMESARFTGTIEGCSFDVTWTGTGLIAPFVRHQAQYGMDWFPDVRLVASAELSRVAPMEATTCFGSFEDVPGFLAQGLDRTEDHAHVDERTGG